MVLRHFALDEFACPCCGRAEMREDFLTLLDRARELAGAPFVVTSGFRCERHNAEVGGVARSAHLTGNGADIACVSSGRRMVIVQGLLAAGFTRIGVGEHFVHADTAPDLPAGKLWVYKA